MALVGATFAAGIMLRVRWLKDFMAVPGIKVKFYSLLSLLIAHSVFCFLFTARIQFLVAVIFV